MILVRICTPCSCHVDYSHKRHVYAWLRQSHRVRIIKKVDVGEDCVCSHCLYYTQWWCAQTFTLDRGVVRHGGHPPYSLYSQHLCLLILPTAVLHTATQRCSCAILEMRDAMQCTLSFISFPTAHKTPFMYHLYHANAHPEMHKHAQCTETVFHGLEHSQLQAGANSRKMIGACECVCGSYWGRESERNWRSVNPIALKSTLTSWKL